MNPNREFKRKTCSSAVIVILQLLISFKGFSVVKMIKNAQKIQRIVFKDSLIIMEAILGPAPLAKSAVCQSQSYIRMNIGTDR